MYSCLVGLVPATMVPGTVVLYATGATEEATE